MNPRELNELTDAELSEVFAAEVAGWIPLSDARPCCLWMVEDAMLNGKAFFAECMDEVLPYLFRMNYNIDKGSTPRNSCIALILAARYDKKVN